MNRYAITAEQRAVYFEKVFKEASLEIRRIKEGRERAENEGRRKGANLVTAPSIELGDSVANPSGSSQSLLIHNMGGSEPGEGHPTHIAAGKHNEALRGETPQPKRAPTPTLPSREIKKVKLKR